MATGTLAPSFYFTALDANGDPLVGAKFYFYLSGGLTPAAVYHDADLSSAWTFPATTDSAGRIVVYLDPALGNLKLVMTDADDVPFGPTVDPVTPTNAGSSGLGTVFDFGSDSTASITQTSYNSGSTFDTLQPGSSVWSVDPATLTGTYKLEAQGVQDTAGTLTIALVNLSDGAPDTPLETVPITLPLTGAMGTSGAIVFPAGGTAKLFGIKAKVSSNFGFVTGVRIVRTA